MPIRPPRLDDRSYADLVDELLKRIPAHTPEWTDPRPGDPGRTLIELFAWLGDALLYRVNFMPERQRLEFLRMVGASMRGPRPATGLVGMEWKDLDKASAAIETVTIAPWAKVQGPVEFESRRNLTIVPVHGVCWHKRELRGDERTAVAPLLSDLAELYELGGSKVRPYRSTPTFPANKALPFGVDLVRESVDNCLWLGLFAGRPEQVEAARIALGGKNGQRVVLSVGVVPAEESDALHELTGGVELKPHKVSWELTSGRSTKRGPEYLELEVVRDGTSGLTRTGVVELMLPASNDIGKPSNDVRNTIDAGVGARPPRLDEDDQNDRLVAWIRLRPNISVDRLALSWVGINAVEIDQRRTVTDVVVGTASGSPDQRLNLPLGGVERSTFALQVEEEGKGWVDWALYEQLALADRDSRAYALDDEEGVVVFGDGLRGLLPERGRRVRVRFMRAGGGTGGNLPSGSLRSITARKAADGSPVSRPLVLTQPVATRGGAAAESLEEAERRIPALLRHRDRAITGEDYVALAASTPGLALGRVEVIKGFKPHQRRTDVPGAVSVMVLPMVDGPLPPNPRPSRHTIEAVHAWLSPRVPLATELYVMGVEYVPLGVGVGFELREGFDRDEAFQAVRMAVRQLFWPLPPGGPPEAPAGWPRGRAVRAREIEVAVARVPGVDEVFGISLFEQRKDGTWKRINAAAVGGAEVKIKQWQLPEVLKLVVSDSEVPDTLDGTDGSGDNEVAIPVVPEVC